jgi:uncharacterized protein (TIGR01777 family)
MKIVIPGGTGQVGQLLARHFHAHGHVVIVLSRTAHSAPWRVVPWDGLTLGSWVAELEQADVCINLAGRSVNCRYTPANRRSIYDSRVLSTRILGEAIASLNQPPAVWLNASTATIYRHSLDRPMDEATGAPDTWNFSIEVAKAWEAAFFSAVTPHTRKVALRSAMTFSADRGGVFDVFLNLVRHGLGGTNSPGNQFVSWIHEVDFIRATEFLIAELTFTGAVNVTSPNPLPNREFLRALREAWGTRVGLPTTPWMIETGTFLMRTESELILKSRQVVPGRLLAANFQFSFPTWPAAALDLVARWRAQNSSYRL